jgi:regulator of PEP synthase PpsR (kinase-PPPase family)
MEYIAFAFMAIIILVINQDRLYHIKERKSLQDRYNSLYNDYKKLEEFSIDKIGKK